MPSPCRRPAVSPGRTPPLFDPPYLPHRQRDEPGRDEQPDDGEADVLQVEPADPGQHAGLDPEPLDEQPDQHDDADD